MKENIKIGLLAVIAFATVGNMFMLSSISEKQEEMSDNQSAVVANQAIAPSNGTNPLNPMAQNPQMPEGVTYVDNKVVPPPTDMKKTSVKWSNMIHDFGKVKQNSTNNFSFQFTNTGKEPLLITNAVGSCGCTVPNYPKEPIMPGKSATIDVEYKPGMQENQQEKTVTVTANTEPYDTQLKIRAFVEK